MKNPKWNENERVTYDRLANTGNGKDREGIEGLAYSAVCEMHASRLEHERAEKFKEDVVDAISMMASGVSRLEDLLGISIRKMSERRFSKMFDECRKETERICDVLYSIKREYVDMTTAHGPMGDHVGTCRTIKVDALEDFIGRMCKAIGLEWKDVVSYAEGAHGKAQ